MSEVNEVEQFSVDRTDTALVIKGDLPYELWVEQGKELNRIGGAIMWWLGDWWAFGEKKYGERAAAVEGMEWSFQTCRIAGWVSRNIETFRRLNVLTWQHHMEVAAQQQPHHRHCGDCTHSEISTPAYSTTFRCDRSARRSARRARNTSNGVSGAIGGAMVSSSANTD